VIVESAYFFEYGIHGMVDFIIGVDASEDVRVERVMERDGRSEDEVRKIMNKQIPNNEKMDLCDFIINNEILVDDWEIKRLNKLFNKISIKYV
jgi:dephospho-CoA kinase